MMHASSCPKFPCSTRTSAYSATTGKKSLSPHGNAHVDSVEPSVPDHCLYPGPHQIKIYSDISVVVAGVDSPVMVLAFSDLIL